VVDIDDPVVSGRADDVAQQGLAILDRAAAQVVAVEVQQVEGEVGELLRSACRYRFTQRIDMRDAAVIRQGDLAVQHHCRQARTG
jgi:hypothetical protein